MFSGHQKRLVPGGKEVTPGEIAVTTQRAIIESSSWLGAKHQFEDLHYSDIESILLKKNLLSSDLIIKSRFQGDIHINAIGHKQAIELESIINQYTNKYAYGRGNPSGGQ